MWRSAPSSPSHQISRSARCGLSDHSLSSRNSWPMNSIGTPGAVRSRPVATRARLRAYQERGSFQSASLGIRGCRWSPSASSTRSWFSMQLYACHACGTFHGRTRPRRSGSRSTRASAPPAAWASASRTPVAQPVGVADVEAHALRRRGDGEPALLAPVLGDQDRLRAPVVERRGEVLAERPPALVVDDADLVEPQAVGVVLLEEHRGVLDQERAHLGPVEREHPSAGPLLAREVEAVAAVRVRGEVEVVDALAVEAAARVVVDDVDQHGEPVQVADVDERLELVDLPAELLRRQRRLPLGGAAARWRRSR